MSSLLILALLGSALLHAIWNAIIKNGSDKLFETVLKTGGGALCALCFLPFLPLPAAASWPFLAASVSIHLFYYLLLAYAYRGADMSYAYTIMRGSSPLFTALVAVFFLGDAIPKGGWAGVLLLSCGILILAVDAARRGSFRLGPTLMALANALVIMGYTVVDGSGVRLAGGGGGAVVPGSAEAYACWVFILNAFPILITALLLRGGAYFHYVRRRWPYGLAGGACSFVAYGLSIWAMARAPISLVAALRESSVIFGMLLSVIILKEQVSLIRSLSILLVLAGAVCIKLA